MKKFLTTLLMLTCILGLTACNGEKETLKHDPQVIKAQAVNMANFVRQDNLVEELKQMPELLDLNDDGLNILSIALFNDYGVRTEGQVVIDGYDSWCNNCEDLGEVTIGNINDVDIDAKEDELIVNVPLQGTIHNGSVEVMFDKNLHITSVTTNVSYSFEEYMKKAGVNTAIGMGTVFIMLIVIMFIIYLLGFCCKSAGQKKGEDKKADSVDKAIEGIVAREESTDDTELVAVIAAAIAAYEGASDTDGFVVRSIKRIR